MATQTFWDIATDRLVVKRAAKIAVIVGVIIALINYGDRIITGQMDTVSWLKGSLTFFVPYCVSTYSSVMAVRDRMQQLED